MSVDDSITGTKMDEAPTVAPAVLPMSIHEPLASTPSTATATPTRSSAAAAIAHEQLISHARTYYTSLGYRVHSGLQFGCELVLYADNPQYVHSDFCVLVLPPDGRVDWRRVQSLTRQMGDWKKTLILAEVRLVSCGSSCTDTGAASRPRPTSSTSTTSSIDVIAPQEDKALFAGTTVKVTELAISTEHAPFRHRRLQTISKTGTVDIGSQRKKTAKVGEKAAGH